MGLLNILIGIVGIVGAIATGGVLGLVAGGLIAAGLAAQTGLIGGSVGKFFKSGLGQGLIAAVSLGSAAYGMFAQDALTSGTAAMNETAAQQVATGAAQQGATDMAGITADTNAALANQAAGTTGQFMASNGVTTLQAASTGDAGAVTQGLTAAQIQNANAQVEATAAQNGIIPPDATQSPMAQQTLTANASQQSATATAEAQGRVAPIGNPNQIAPDLQAPPSAGGAAPGAAPGGATPPAGGGGLISKGMDMINKNPGLATVAGQGVAGLAQGISQEKQLEQMFQMSNWGNFQWQDPNQVGALQKAAAAPITVPTGYLNRAAAVRALMQGNSQQTGPVIGPQPAATGAAAAPPTGAAASGVTPASPVPGPMSGVGPQTPVPIAGMNATPRGGVI